MTTDLREALNHRPYRVLLVEDNEDDYLIVRDLLSDIVTSEFDLTWVDTYHAAREALTQNQFDVCLLDYSLGESTGVDLVREFGVRGTPFILLTGNEDYEVDVAAAKAGAVDYLLKGHINPLLLERAIRYATQRARADASVLASEIRYRRLFESARDGILILDAKSGQIEDVNPHLCQLLGYVPEDFLGRQLWEIGTFRDIVPNQETFHTLQEREYIRYDDLPLVTKDGQSISVEFVSNVYVSGIQQVIQCNIRDISERKLAQAAERESQRFLQSTVDALSSHIAVLDESGKLIAVNKAWRQFSEANGGTAAGCDVGANYLEVCERASGEGAHVGQMVARGIRAVSASQDAYFCIEYPCHSLSGERWFNVYVTRFAGAGPIRVVVAHENITGRKQAEYQVVSSEANLARAQQIAHLGSWELDLSNNDNINTNPLHWSDEVFRIFGYQPGEIEVSNENFFSAVHPADRGKIKEAISRALSDSVPYHLDHRILLPDGRERIVNEQAEIVFDERTGKPAKMVGTVQDITERKQAEYLIRVSEANLAKSQEMAHLGSWELDLANLDDINANPLRWSDEIFRILGYTPGEFEPSNEAFFRAVHPDDRAILSSAMSEAVAGGKPYSVEHRIVLPDGRERIVHAQAEILYNEDTGLPVKIVGLGQDITDRRLAEATLLESEARFRTAISEAPVPIMIHREDGKVLQISRGWTEYSGYELVDIPTIQDWAERAYGEASAEVHDYIKTLYRVEKTRSEGERTITAKSGQKRVWDFITTPLGTFGDDQRVVISTALDITESKQAKEALEARTREIVTIWESMTDAFFTLDTQWRFTHVNSQAGYLWRKNPEDLIGKSIWEVFPTAVDSVFDTEYHRAIEEQVVVNFEGFYAPANTWREVHAYPSPLGLTVYFRDITERKLAEAQLHFQKTLLEAQTEASLDGILVMDAGEGKKILSHNRRLLQMWGIPHDLAVSGNDAALHEAILSKVFNQEEVSTEAAFLYDHPTEHTREQIVLLNGQIFDRYSVPINDANGSHFGRVWFFRDITESKKAENTLRASEERFQSIVANVPGMVYQFEMRPDGSVGWPFLGQEFQEIFEGEPEILKSAPCWPMDQVHPDDRNDFDSSVAASKDTLLPRSWEGRIRLASGTTKWIQITSRPQQLPSGGTLWNGLVMDITARKAAEEERDRFFTLSLDMLAIVGRDGYFKRINPAWETTLGFSTAEMMTAPYLEWVHPDDRAATLAEDTRLVRGNEEVMQFENRYRCRDGSYKWLRWMSASFEDLFYCVAHDITAMREAEAALQQANDELEERVEERTSELAQSNKSLQNEITEREEAEAEIRARARQQEAVAELGRQALTNVDIDSLLLGATQLVTATLNVELSTVLELMPGGDVLRIRTSTGWRGDSSTVEVPGSTRSQAGYAVLSQSPVIVSELKTETRFEPSRFMLDQGIRSGITVVVGGREQPFGTLGAHSIQQRQFTQDDVHFLQAVSNVLAAALEQRRVNEQLRIENIERQSAMGVLQEVTAGLKVAKEEAEQAKVEADAANLAKSEFLSRMSHELRTRLNAILGFGQLLALKDLKPKEVSAVEQILKGGRHLLDLINEVLDIARVEAGHLEISLEPIALDEVIPELCALVRPLAEQRQIRLSQNIHIVNFRYVMADRQRFKQVLINLLSNAIKYNREAGQVEVSCEQRLDGWLSISVRDTGPGISPEDLPKLFTPFERLNASNSAVEGTGLGLVLSQRMVTAMGGTLNVQSTLGRGTTFILELPQAASPEDQIEHQPGKSTSVVADESASSQITVAYSVLCIEDNPSNLQLMEEIFEARPEIVLLAAIQGSVGLDLARQHEPDLILLDLNLPDLDGRQVLARLQQSDVTKNIPVVVISADATAHQIERLLADGARAYLTKPLDIRQFVRTVDELLQQTPKSKESDAPQFINTEINDSHETL